MATNIEVLHRERVNCPWNFFEARKGRFYGILGDARDSRGTEEIDGPIGLFGNGSRRILDLSVRSCSEEEIQVGRLVRM